MHLLSFIAKLSLAQTPALALNSRFKEMLTIKRRNEGPRLSETDMTREWKIQNEDSVGPKLSYYLCTQYVCYTTL